jgi:hypothetical protein
MFLGLFFALEINSKKNLPYRIGPSPWARPNPLRPGRQALQAHRPSRHGRRRPGQGVPARIPIKGGGRASRRDLAALHSRHRRPVAARAAACCSTGPRAARSELASPALTSDFRPPPFVSVAGEHTFAIPLISSLRFTSHSSP